jgi:hypothetical protein
MTFCAYLHILNLGIGIGAIFPLMCRVSAPLNGKVRLKRLFAKIVILMQFLLIFR